MVITAENKEYKKDTKSWIEKEYFVWLASSI